MRVTLALLLILLSACADRNPHKAPDQTGSLSTERAALYHQAREAEQQSRERYIATTRPALQRQFRHEYPTMLEADIEVLVNDALEKGLPPRGRTQTGWSDQAAPNGIAISERCTRRSSWRSSLISA